MVSVASKGTFEEALVLLWAMEEVSTLMQQNGQGQSLILSSSTWTLGHLHRNIYLVQSLPQKKRALLKLYYHSFPIGRLQNFKASLRT
jgi:hypothetical protein